MYYVKELTGDMASWEDQHMQCKASLQKRKISWYETMTRFRSDTKDGFLNDGSLVSAEVMNGIYRL